MICYNLKLPKKTDFIPVISSDGLNVGTFVEFEKIVYVVKRKYMTNEAGHMIQLEYTKEKPEKVAQVRRHR